MKFIEAISVPLCYACVMVTAKDARNPSLQAAIDTLSDIFSSPCLNSSQIQS